jgi:hypothetical protein
VWSEARPGQEKTLSATREITKAKGTKGIAQVVEHLPSKHEALSLVKALINLLSTVYIATLGKQQQDLLISIKSPMAYNCTW